MKITTLNNLRQTLPHRTDFTELLARLGKTKFDNEPLSFLAILNATGFDFTVKCCVAAPEFIDDWRLFAVWCGRRVQHLMQGERFVNAIDVAEELVLEKSQLKNRDARRDNARNSDDMNGENADDSMKLANGAALLTLGFSDKCLCCLDVPDAAARATSANSFNKAVDRENEKSKLTANANSEVALTSAEHSLRCRILNRICNNALISEKNEQERQFIQIIS